MDNKQAIEELKTIKQNHIDLNYRFRHLYDDYIIAVDKAIASLEAWDKVIEELEYFYDGKSYYEHAIAIVRKHLKEIEECIT